MTSLHARKRLAPQRFDPHVEAKASDAPAFGEQDGAVVAPRHRLEVTEVGRHRFAVDDFEDARGDDGNQFLDMMVVTMGGRVAEQLIFDEVTTGASNDLERATKIALGMIKRYGMSEALGPRTFGKREELVFLGREISEERDYGDKVAEEIDEEVKGMIVDSYNRAEEILVTHKPKLVKLAEYLIINETLSGDGMVSLLSECRAHRLCYRLRH